MRRDDSIHYQWSSLSHITIFFLVIDEEGRSCLEEKDSRDLIISQNVVSNILQMLGDNRMFHKYNLYLFFRYFVGLKVINSEMARNDNNILAHLSRPEWIWYSFSIAQYGYYGEIMFKISYSNNFSKQEWHCKIFLRIQLPSLDQCFLREWFLELGNVLWMIQFK